MLEVRAAISSDGAASTSEVAARKARFFCSSSRDWRSMVSVNLAYAIRPAAPPAPSTISPASCSRRSPCLGLNWAMRSVSTSAPAPAGTATRQVVYTTPPARAINPARQARAVDQPTRPLALSDAPTRMSAAVAAERPIRRPQTVRAEFIWRRVSLGLCSEGEARYRTYTSCQAQSDGFRAPQGLRPPRSHRPADGPP